MSVDRQTDGKAVAQCLMRGAMSQNYKLLVNDPPEEIGCG